MLSAYLHIMLAALVLPQCGRVWRRLGRRLGSPRCGVVRTGVEAERQPAARSRSSPRPSARRRGVVRPGVATDYCVQTLGCTLEDAVRAEAKMLPQVANSVRRDKAEVVCAELRAKLGLSDHEMRKLVLRVPTVLTLNMDKNVNPKLDWLQERLDLSRDELKKICLTLPATLAYSVDKNLEPKLCRTSSTSSGCRRQEIPVQDHLHARPPGLQHREARRPRLAAIRATAGADPAAVIDRIRAADAEFCKRTGVSIDTLRREQARVTARQNGSASKRVFAAADAAGVADLRPLQRPRQPPHGDCEHDRLKRLGRSRLRPADGAPCVLYRRARHASANDAMAEDFAGSRALCLRCAGPWRCL